MTVDTNASGTATLTFRYHMYGADMESYYVYWETISGGTVGHTQLWTKTGQQQIASNRGWDQATIDMTPFIGTTGYLKLVAVLSPSTGFKNDAAFCQFYFDRSYGSNNSYSYTNASAWLSHDSGNAVASSNPVDALTINTPNTRNSTNVANATWSITNATTPSVDTGPDKHHNDGSTNTYLYFESSGASKSYTAGYLVKSHITFTI